MYTIREFAKKRINSGVFARFVLVLSGIAVRENEFAVYISARPAYEVVVHKIYGRADFKSLYENAVRGVAFISQPFAA